jgi:hypothetical protein
MFPSSSGGDGDGDGDGDGKTDSDGWDEYQALSIRRLTLTNRW